MNDVRAEQAYWDQHARYDPLWAILSEPSKAGRRWTLEQFLETGRREVSILMYQLGTLGLNIGREAALDFGCGIGRLSQPLARYFSRVVGVDVSPEMIRLAGEINPLADRIRYVCNSRDDLAGFRDGEFTFAYSNVVLQHIEPARAAGYVAELLRVIDSGGVLVFQLPSHPRRAAEQHVVRREMPEDAYRAAIAAIGDVPRVSAPGAEMTIGLAVTNLSRHTWSQAEVGPIRVGNHWRDGSGRTMLVQDDGRVSLPEAIDGGTTSHITLTVSAPPDPGMYQLECDVVHEGITWFADRGSVTWRAPVEVGPGRSTSAAPVEPSAATGDSRALTLPDISTVPEPAPLPMHGVHRDEVARIVRGSGGTIAHVDVDERCGREWVGYRYFVRKD